MNRPLPIFDDQATLAEFDPKLAAQLTLTQANKCTIIVNIDSTVTTLAHRDQLSQGFLTNCKLVSAKGANLYWFSYRHIAGHRGALMSLSKNDQTINLVGGGGAEWAIKGRRTAFTDFDRHIATLEQQARKFPDAAIHVAIHCYYGDPSLFVKVDGNHPAYGIFQNLLAVTAGQLMSQTARKWVVIPRSDGFYVQLSVKLTKIDVIATTRAQPQETGVEIYAGCWIFDHDALAMVHGTENGYAYIVADDLEEAQAIANNPKFATIRGVFAGPDTFTRFLALVADALSPTGRHALFASVISKRR